ncbi:hypothetical protein MA16_Dca004742 [Dendrobium catenatum]|uniref:Reverse transcriptase RNase H-like domain-containing protein n=1 Tax=Dendrobium catenatum TaxID=906689 RepID=A0A2I0VNZ2_9ASPA|nr:hypothetical protein MA16_Dca004742 [Dendrobium catenatum]
MGDASDYVIEETLGNKLDKKFHFFYFASRTLNDAHINFTTIGKEFLDIGFAFNMFKSYLIGTKVIIFTIYYAIKYLLIKEDAKPKLIKWILLLQEFNVEILDRKYSKT